MLDARLRQRQKLEAIGTLASGVAHEINNPINGIMNYAQLIDDRLDPESSLRQFAQGIGEETERVATIVRNLLTFSRHDEESHSPACVADLVNDTLSLVHAVIRKDQISLDVDVPRDLPLINCRSQQIQQAIMNLLTNARDALNQRYPEHDPDKIMKLTVRPFEKLERRWIRITVEDHGAGIADEIRDRVFDPFFTTKGRAEGTGLGLSISRSIVQDHHGELYVESKPGQQTRFQLELPVDNGYSRDGTPRQ
jgi:signal transduction histidine kinase